MKIIDIILLLIIISIFVIDFQNRLVSENMDSVDNSKVSANIDINIAMLDESMVKAVFEDYKKYNIEKTFTSTSVMTDEQQSKQNGMLNQLYSREHVFQLKATFQDELQVFALIETINVISKERELIKVTVNEQLNDYLINKIGQDELILVRGDIEIQLVLYHPES